MYQKVMSQTVYYQDELNFQKELNLFKRNKTRITFCLITITFWFWWLTNSFPMEILIKYYRIAFTTNLSVVCRTATLHFLYLQHSGYFVFDLIIYYLACNLTVIINRSNFYCIEWKSYYQYGESNNEHQRHCHRENNNSVLLVVIYVSIN